MKTTYREAFFEKLFGHFILKLTPVDHTMYHRADKINFGLRKLKSGESFWLWQKDSLITQILFELCLL